MIIKQFIKKGLINRIGYNMGLKTESAVHLLKNFNPKTPEDCLEAIQKVNECKEFLKSTPFQESFTDKIEYIFMEKQK